MTSMVFFRNVKLGILTCCRSKSLVFCSTKGLRYFDSVRNINLCSKLYSNISEEKDVNIHVYEAPLKTKVKYVKFLSLSSSMLGFSMLPIVVKDLIKVNIWLGCAAGAISTFFLSTPLLLHWITKGYVLDLYYNSETGIFTATTYNIASQVKKIQFKASDVLVPELPGMLSSFHVKGVPLFVDSRLVKDPEAYSHMMGYDKPLDFKLYENNQKESVKSS